MQKTKGVIACLLLLTTFHFSHAQSKTTAIKNGAPYVKMIEAYSQRIMPGARDLQPQTKYSIVLIWKGRAQPNTFFWRGESGWWNAATGKGHKVVKKTSQFTPDYMATPLVFTDIKKGDTLLINPGPGGKFPIPTQIPATAKNTLYFQMGNAKQWYAVPVKNLTKKRDLPTP